MFISRATVFCGAKFYSGCQTLGILSHLPPGLSRPAALRAGSGVEHRWTAPADLVSQIQNAGNINPNFVFATVLCLLRTSRRRQWRPTPVLLPGKSYGWRSLVGCSPWGRWEPDTTEWLSSSSTSLLRLLAVVLLIHLAQHILSFLYLVVH